MRGVGLTLGKILRCFFWVWIPLQADLLVAQPSHSRWTATDLFELEYAVDPRISPDGSRVAYVRETPNKATDVWLANIWLVTTNGKTSRPLTTGMHQDFAPRWSPDGRSLAFLSDRDGSVQIHLLRVDSGRLTRLTDLEQSPSRIAWSPDGKWLAFAALQPRPPPKLIDLPTPPEGAHWAKPPQITDRLVYRTDAEGYLEQGVLRLFVVPVSGGTPRRVSRDEEPFHEVALDPINVDSNASVPAWTPDGKYLLSSANRRPDWELRPLESEVVEFSLEDGTIRPLTARHGPDASPVISPDGRHIAYIGFDDKRLGYQVARLHLMHRDGTKSRVLTAKLDRSVRGPRWTGDSQGLLFRYHDQGDTKIAHVDLKGRVRDLTGSISDGSGTYGGGSFTLAASGEYAFTYSRAQVPVEIGVASIDVPEIRAVTSINQKLVAGKTLAEVEEIRFASARDQRQIQGWVVKPPNFDPARRYPLILEIHGGPFRDYGKRFDPEKQIWAAMDYLVLYINQRGSVGYGEDFGNLIHHKYPGDDLFDLRAAVDTVIQRGWADPDNLFITGGSGGAMLACWATAHSNRFRAAVAAYPLVNWTSFTLTTDISAWVTYYWFPGPPWKHPEAYIERSPIWRVGDVNTPTMLIVGGEDYRTPAAEAEQYYTALKHRGIDTLLVRFEGAPHFSERRPSHQISRVLLTIGWFNRYRGSDDPGQRVSVN